MSAQSRQPPASIVLPGTLLEILGIGVLLSGESGSGKSDAVLGLLGRGHRLVADDAVEFYRRGARLYGRCPEGLRGLVAVRGLGVLDVRQLFGPRSLCASKAVALEIALGSHSPPADARMVEQDIRTIMDTAVPRLRLPAVSGRDLPLLLETAVRAYAPAGGRTPQLRGHRG